MIHLEIYHRDMAFKQLHQGIIRFGFTGGCRSSGGRWLVSRNYRQITLLSVPGKVFAHVLLARIKPLLLKNRCLQQSGFTTGRSSVADEVLARRLLPEIRRKFGRSQDLVYIDHQRETETSSRLHVPSLYRRKSTTKKCRG